MIRKSDIGIGRGQQDMFLSINVFTKTYAKQVTVSVTDGTLPFSQTATGNL